MPTDLKPSQVFKWLKAKIKMAPHIGFVRPMYLAGGPGIGKTALVEALGAALGISVITWIAATMDPTDLRFPVIIDKQLEWITPKELAEKSNFILFLDELPNAPQSVLNGLQNMVWTRKIGEYKLSDGCIIIAAGNRTTDRAGSGRLNTAMATRFLKVNMVPDVDDFRAWGAAPRDASNPSISRIHPMVLSFLKFRPVHFYSFDPKKDAFSCPRILEFISDSVYENEPDAQLRKADYENAGDDFAIEFLAYEQMYKDAIQPDTILRNPTGAPLPRLDDPAGLWATSTALAWTATAANIDLIITYLERLPEEYTISAVSLIEARNPALANTSDLTLFNIRHNAALT